MDSILFKIDSKTHSPHLSHQFRLNTEMVHHGFTQKLDLDGSNGARVNPYNQGVDAGDGEAQRVSDFPDTCLKYMSEILMEEALDDPPNTLEGYWALQAREKEFYDALGTANPTPSVGFSSCSSLDSSNCLSDSPCNHGSSPEGERCVECHGQLVLFPLVGNASDRLETNVGSYSSSDGFDGASRWLLDAPVTTLMPFEATRNEINLDWPREAILQWPIPNLDCQCKLGGQGCPLCEWRGNDLVPGAVMGASRGKKNQRRDDIDYEHANSNKVLAAYDEEVEMEQYDDVFLCKDGKDNFSESGWLQNEAEGKSDKSGKQVSNYGRTRGKKRSDKKEELVDLTTLLTHCAQSAASFDTWSAKDLLKQIRQHSSPHGDSLQRLAHYFAVALDARLMGNGVELSIDLHQKGAPASEVLKAHRVYASAIPFRRTSYFVANKTILDLAEGASRLHIIDFGIFYGFQWPCIIKNLARRAGGPPIVRITGIDEPLRGFRPTKLVDDIGKRLARYGERFGVPFQYQSIAMKWEHVQPEDLNIEEGEVVVVNCLYGPKNLFDETVDSNSPRDAFFRLIRKLNPNLFIVGIVNGAFNAPFFSTRFREALFYYSSVFDLLEATVAHEDHERVLIERELFGKSAQNVIACEGTERVERSETYKQWQIRMLRAGLRQTPLSRETLTEAKAKVKANYNKNFVVGEDNHWVIQGWKGRILYALSCWKPA